MKPNYLYLNLLVLSCTFCACHNGAVEPNNNVENIVILQNSNTEESAIFAEVNLSESTVLTNACEELQAEYALLIEKINKRKNDKQLISELIAWTKKPSHLNCLESDLAYNAQIEKLNTRL